MFLLRAVLNILVSNASPRGPMCFRCLIFNLSSSLSHHSKPRWYDNIKYLRDYALSWHYFWKINSSPGTGYIAEMRRLSRARYHRVVRHLKRAETRMRTEKMAEALISNRSKDL